MNEAAQDAWFYSREGEKLGPVTFEVLRVKVSEGGLNPRLDMVWTHGMVDWKPAGEIAGLFERRAMPEVQENLATPAEDYTLPDQQSAAEHMSREGNWPGARRRSYLFATLVLPFVIHFVVALSSVMMKTIFGAQIVGLIESGVAFLPLLFVIYFSVQRLVNLGMSRWWFLGNFVPFLNIWLGYRCFACPGGYAYHKKLDGAGIFLAMIYWLVLAITVLAIAVIIAVLYGGLGTPELRQQIQDAVRNYGDIVRGAAASKA